MVKIFAFGNDGGSGPQELGEITRETLDLVQ